jgi:hypothetical protein
MPGNDAFAGTSRQDGAAGAKFLLNWGPRVLDCERCWRPKKHSRQAYGCARGSIRLQLMDRSGIELGDNVTVELGYDGSAEGLYRRGCPALPSLSGVRVLAGRTNSCSSQVASSTKTMVGSIVHDLTSRPASARRPSMKARLFTIRARNRISVSPTWRYGGSGWATSSTQTRTEDHVSASRRCWKAGFSGGLAGQPPAALTSRRAGWSAEGMPLVNTSLSWRLVANALPASLGGEARCRGDGIYGKLVDGQ